MRIFVLVLVLMSGFSLSQTRTGFLCGQSVNFLLRDTPLKCNFVTKIDTVGVWGKNVKVNYKSHDLRLFWLENGTMWEEIFWQHSWDSKTSLFKMWEVGSPSRTGNPNFFGHAIVSGDFLVKKAFVKGFVTLCSEKKLPNKPHCQTFQIAQALKF